MNNEQRKALKKIFQFHKTYPLRLISRESPSLEFKESFNWNSRSTYAKTLVAFANRKGGFIIFGVKDNPRDLVGLQNDKFENMDGARIAEYLNSVFSPEINFEKSMKNIKGKKVGLLYAYESSHKPVVALKADGDIKEADIYYRYNARNDKIKYGELKALLDDIRKKEEEAWMDLLKKIGKVGVQNSAILDFTQGKIEGQDGNLLIDEQLIPKLKFIKQGRFQEKGSPALKLEGNVQPIHVVGKRKDVAQSMRLTTDPNAQAAKIDEKAALKGHKWDYARLTENLRKRYSDFKQNKKYHRVRKKIIEENPSFRYRRLLDPDKPKSTFKDYYHPDIISAFDKHYTQRK